MQTMFGGKTDTAGYIKKTRSRLGSSGSVFVNNAGEVTDSAKVMASHRLNTILV